MFNIIEKKMATNMLNSQLLPPAIPLMFNFPGQEKPPVMYLINYTKRGNLSCLRKYIYWFLFYLAIKVISGTCWKFMFMRDGTYLIRL